jgi:Molybdenum cofactor biosynthesis enzyme
MKAALLENQAPGGARTPLEEKLPLSTPYVLQFFPIYACNFVCKYCHFSIEKEKRCFVTDRISMSMDLYKKCVNDIAMFPEKIRTLRFVGMGEPLMHRNIAEMVHLAKLKNIANRVEILTNGSLLNQRMTNNLVAAGLDRLVISLQGVSARAYKEVSGIDLDFDHFVEQIAYFYAHKGQTHMHLKVVDIALHGNSNPYFKMDFPSQYAADVLEFFAAQGIVQLRTCVEGEPTIYSKWHEVFSRFHARHPHIKLRMTTNLSRPYTDEEIEFLTQYSELDISCDTLDPVLYAKLRRGGRLDLVLENIRRVCEKADALKVRGPFITLHAVVSDVTWSGLEDLTDYALANGYLVLFGNYEERFNTVAFRENICRPLGQMTREEQVEAQKCFQRILLKLRGLTDAQRGGHAVEDFFQGNLLYNLDANVAMDYNHFKPYDSNPLHSAFFKQYPLGKNYMHLDIVYDYDNISYSGVLFLEPVKLELHGFFATHVVVREVSIFKKGKCSSKYDSVVLPGYRKTIKIENDYFAYEPKFGEDVEKVLLEISEYW